MKRQIVLSQSDINQIVIQHLVNKDIAKPKIPHSLLWNVIRDPYGVNKVVVTVTLNQELG